MLSVASRVMSFVAHCVLEAEDPEEVDLLGMDVAYSELARLQDQKNQLMKLKAGAVKNGPDLQQLLEEVQLNTSISEQAADLACGSLLEPAYRFSGATVPHQKFRSEAQGSVSALKGNTLARAGAHVAVCSSDESASRSLGRLDMRRSQVNPAVVRDLSSSALEVAAIKGPVCRKTAQIIDNSSIGTTKTLGRMRGIRAFFRNLVGKTEPEVPSGDLS